MATDKGNKPNAVFSYSKPIVVPTALDLTIRADDKSCHKTITTPIESNGKGWVPWIRDWMVCRGANW